MKKNLLLAVLAGILSYQSVAQRGQDLSSAAVAAESVDSLHATHPALLWGVAVKAGLNGLGFEVIKGFGERLNLRLGLSAATLPWQIAQELEGFDLQADVQAHLGYFSFLADYYLARRFFHVTSGLMYNRFGLELELTPQSGFQYGDLTIPAEALGTLSARLRAGNTWAPYAGIGIGNTLSRKRIVSFDVELGMLYQGSPRLELDGSGIIGPMASEHNEQVINAALAPYGWLPHLSFQLTFRIL